MALSINHVTLAGNLVRNAEYKTTQSGLTVTTFSIAVSKRTKDSNGNWQNEADFFDCVLFGRLGESFRDNNSLTKGTPVALEGRLQLDRWQNKEGENRSRVTVIADVLIPYSRQPRDNSGHDYSDNHQDQQHNQYGYNNTQQPQPASNNQYGYNAQYNANPGGDGYLNPQQAYNNQTPADQQGKIPF